MFPSYSKPVISFGWEQSRESPNHVAHILQENHYIDRFTFTNVGFLDDQPQLEIISLFAPKHFLRDAF